MIIGSVLEYTLAFMSAALDKHCSKWSATPKTGFIDITTSKDFYRIFSGLQIGSKALLEAMKKARRLNNHVYSMLKARCPLEDKTACAIKQSGAPLHHIRYENTI
ncbi:PIR-like protein [Drosera capensis]